MYIGDTVLLDSNPQESLLVFRDRAPWLVKFQGGMLVVVSAFVMLGPMFNDGHRIMVACAFPLGAYLVLLSAKKGCTNIEFKGEEIHLKTLVGEHVLNWTQVNEIVLDRKKRTTILRTAAGDFMLQKTFGKMDELMKYLEYRSAQHRIQLIDLR